MARHNPSPFAKRSLGQNFLVDDNVSRKIVQSLAAEPGDRVVEIGPGRGALTGWLTEQDGIDVLALEKDLELALGLKSAHPSLAVAAVDAMCLDWSRLSRLRPLRLVGNLPYNVASPLMWDILSRVEGFSIAVFMVQLEVARRIVALPGNREYGALSVWLQSFTRARLLFTVSPQVFRPRPKVHSAVVAFTPVPAQERPKRPEDLSVLLKACFQKRRKQLGTILRPVLDEATRQSIGRNGLEITCRPEELSPESFQWLARELSGRFSS